MPGADDASIAFDRAADYYDRTRGFTEEGHRRTIELLASEFAGRGAVLEIGVGTAQVALSLRAAGVPATGVDLSMPMMARARAKPGGRELPLVQGDGLRLPFADAAFGGAYFRWVLHLVPRWRDLMGELVRVTRPRGVIVASLGGYSGVRKEIQEHFAELAGVAPIVLPGLGLNDWPPLDEAMRELGAAKRELPTFHERERDGLTTFFEALEAGMYSWTWSIPDDERRRALAETRAWAEARFGPLEDVPRAEFEVVFHAYDVP